MAEPINLLALDGGGVRGISEAVILHELMVKIKELKSLPEVPKPCDYFHLIGGTSTGGLLAIMLGRLRMTTEEAIEAYQQCSGSIFRRSNKRFRILARGYRPGPLVKAVQGMVANRAIGDTMHDPDRHLDQRGHSFVCAVTTSNPREPVHFRTYNLVSDAVGDDGAPKCLVWEASRATTAAPTFFKRMTIDGIDYFDGAMAANNPSESVLLEARNLFGADRDLGCLLSIGTGLGAPSLDSTKKGILYQLLGGVDLKQMAKFAKDAMTDCETTHKNIQRRFSSFEKSYFRFNVDGEAKTVKLDAYKKMDFLKNLTMQYVRQPEVAARLLEVAKTLAGGLSENLTLGKSCFALPDKIKPEARSEGAVSNFFIGRQDVLSRLNSFFEKRPSSGPRPRREFMLGGMGGVGKTQVTVKFGQDYEYLFPGGVFWVDGTSEITIVQSYTSLAINRFGLVGDEAAIKGVLKCLEASEDEWLIIFDNRWEKSVDEFLPRKSRGNVLYTTRHTALKSQLPRNAYLDVDVLNKGESVELLLNIAGKDENDLESAANIVELLGYLPLGIDIFGKFMRNSNHDFVDYVRMLRHRWAELRANSPGFEDFSAAIQGLCASFDISYIRLHSIASSREEPPARSAAARIAISLLDIVCFYHNTGFLEETVERLAFKRNWRREEKGQRVREMPEFEPMLQLKPGHEEYDHDWDSELFRNAMAVLCGLSFMKPDVNGKKSYCMHVLVHKWARERMSEHQRWTNLLRARCFLSDSLASDKEGKGPSETMYRTKVIPHVMECRFTWGQPNGENNQLEYLQDYAFSMMLNSSSMFPEAIQLLEHSLKIMELCQVPIPINMYEKLSFLYNCRRWRGEGDPPYLQDGERAYSKAVSALAERFGLHSRRTVQEIVDYARFYANQNLENKALEKFHEAIAVAMEGFGPENEVTLSAKESLAKYLLRGYEDTPEPNKKGVILMNQVLHARRKLYVDHDLDSAGFLKLLDTEAYFTLVTMNWYLGDEEELSQVLHILGKVIDVYKLKCGNDDPRTLSHQNNYAKLCIDSGRLDEAERVLTEAYQVALESYGETDLKTTILSLSLANVKGTRGELKEMVSIMEENRQIIKRQLNSENEVTRMLDDGLVSVKQSLSGTGVLND